MRKAPPPTNHDPWPYKGSLRRIDGTAPYNHYLWPLDEDWYWASQDLGHRYSSRWEFSAVALADGRWLSDGFIRHDENEMRFFSTREAALRHAAVRLLRTIRHARHWHGTPDYVSPEQYPALVKWVFDVLGRPAPRVYVPPAPPPRPPKSLLEIMEREPFAA